MTNERTGDVILSQGTYIYVQDGASGQVDIIVGPHKQSLADTDKPVVFDPRTGRFNRVSSPGDAIQPFLMANEGEYMVLTNPNKGDLEHPKKGKHNTVELTAGLKINIPGPYNIALFPGQIGKVIRGHQLKSNEYLVVRVYNEDAAKKNHQSAIIKGSETEAVESASNQIIPVKEIVIGKLFIIKGTDVSFYIPPTGFEVIADSDAQWVRDAVTLERLEYSILLDQNGDKRFVEGPKVVFPSPTEKFVEQGSTNKFKAIELNENMGIYVKVIADYQDNGEDGKKYSLGDELFITGKDQRIYYPRPEHAIVKYGTQLLHYAVAIPNGEARYALDKNTGEVNTIKGPKMYLPDPRKEVIVKRVLDDKTVELWFPSNREAQEYNTSLSAAGGGTGELYRGMEDMNMAKSRVSFSAVSEEMQRSEKFTKPRTITLDTKYEGTVNINVWPGFAVQVVKKTGERRVEIGPEMVLLEFDETLELLELSTGKPKSDNKLMKTVYLQVNNNIVSDIIEAETKDAVNVNVRLSYRVNFEEEHKDKWYSVPNYVKLLTQHLRSMIRNAVKKVDIETFNNTATDMIRDLVLGKQSEAAEGKTSRPGRTFADNGMKVYDVEVLNITIGDHNIAQMLQSAQHSAVSHNLDLQQEKKSLDYVIKVEEMTRQKLEHQAQTKKLRAELAVKEITEAATAELLKLKNEQEKQELLDNISEKEMARGQKVIDQSIDRDERLMKIRVEEVKEKNASITPKLVEALMSLSNTQFVDTLARNLKIQNGGLGGMFPKGGFDGIMETIKGTPLEKMIQELANNSSSESKN